MNDKVKITIKSGQAPINELEEVNDAIELEQWDKVLEIIVRNRKLISTIDISQLAQYRFHYQLSRNENYVYGPNLGSFSDLLNVIEICKIEGVLAATIPQATVFQQMGQIKNLLEQGHNIDEEDFGDRTSLLVAATLNDFELVKFFIDTGANVSHYDYENYEAIDLTTSKQIIDFLQKHGGKTKEQRQQEYDEYCDEREYFNILREINLSYMKGAEAGNIKQMEDALQKCSLDFFTLNFAYPTNGKTALHLAVENNQIDVVKFLFKKGIDKTKKNNDGLTALDTAKKLNYFEIIKEFENDYRD
jgi:ankyrin repeat protein